ncbi:ABC transporter permease [Nocardioides sp. Root122]|uniref:branched-chain amino acid ABC transporter permease n=1 Tax=Nocardioides TaxID=1839 RepID=UPI000702E6C5|nr:MULTISPECIES: branched-chain amino acid ABC transporter permease [Nocardioides]KQV77651.1 ABC transporter permease [Nocardioides sp. Root122]MCK9822104.1 branched-chain amino acid ABC transporter permease [Nocardioides cavernae]
MRAKIVPLGLGAALVVVLAVLPLLSIQVPGILPGPTYTPGSLQLLALCMVYAALALSYNLLLGTGGQLSFGHALYFGGGAYGLGILLERTDLALWPAVALTLAGVGAIAVVTGAVSLRVTGIPFAMVTLAFAQAGSVLVRRNPDGLTGGDEGLSVDTEHVPAALVGVVHTRNLYWLALAVVVVAYLVVLWIDRSRVGHVAAAARENELRVRALGLQPYAAKLVVFVASGLLAALAGVAYMLLQSGTVPRSVGADLTITVLVMVVLGGVGSRWGAIIGGVLYTLLNQRLTLLARSDAVESLPSWLHVPLSEPMFILGGLFVLVVLFVPGGIAGTATRLTGRRRTRTGVAVLEAADSEERALEPQP